MIHILLTIAARGGSQGVKGKNIRPINGKPLIAYTIEKALSWKKAKRVIVSTDSKDIADVAKAYGALVPFMRPAELASHTASKGLVLKHALLECEKMYKESYDVVVDLDVTAPIRSLKDLDNCLEIYNKYKPTTLFSVVEAHKNPYFNMVEEKKDGRIELSKSLGKQVHRRQDSPKVYAMNASIYFYEANYVRNSADPSPFSGHTRLYVMDDLCSVDIDREIDFKFVEFLIKEGLVKL